MDITVSMESQSVQFRRAEVQSAVQFYEGHLKEQRIIKNLAKKEKDHKRRENAALSVAWLRSAISDCLKWISRHPTPPHPTPPNTTSGSFAYQNKYK